MTILAENGKMKSTLASIGLLPTLPKLTNEGNLPIRPPILQSGPTVASVVMKISVLVVAARIMKSLMTSLKAVEVAHHRPLMLCLRSAPGQARLVE